ncbi:M14 family metallopeptidase [Thiogranum longum]|uniref:M14 family metallopeptidase n=1 Tax=Thiogranum longum TaxID=1537524 RepID=UPI0010501D3D|nr:M14 family metallopeptidase [Thiogranum longum]
MLHKVDTLPESFIDAQPEQLADLLGGPTLVHLQGRRERPLFVSVLLHGNETTGLLAVQALLQRYYDRELPRTLSLFIGNVDAARDGLRRLAGQPDYNRVWPGSECQDTPEKRMMSEVFDIMRERRPFASVDVHNNTGINPHYACINRVDHRYVQLASLFSRTLVYFTRPKGVQSLAFSETCPAVTVECGKVGQAAGEQHALEFLDACLHLNALPDQPVADHDVDVFHTVAIVRVPRSFSFGFGDVSADINFIEDLDHLNFRELPAGSTLAYLNDVTSLPLEASDEQGNEVAARYFTMKDGLLQTARPLMPSMFTLDERVIRQDCLGYLMERYPLPAQ